MGPAKFTRFFTYVAVFAAGSLAAGSFFSVTNPGFFSQSVEAAETSSAVSLPPVAISGDAEITENPLASLAPAESTESELEPVPAPAAPPSDPDPEITETPRAIVSAAGETNTTAEVSEAGQAVQTVAEQSTTAASAAPASNITPISELVRGSRVVVEGVVERVTDEDEFIIADNSGSVMVWTGSTFYAVEQGESVLVSGFVDDDLVLEIYAQRITKANGDVIEVRGEW